MSAARPKGWTFYVPVAVGILTILSVITGAAVKVDARYETREAAKAMADDNERDRLETKLQLYQLQLAQLRSKLDKSADDEQEIAYLVGAIAAIRARLDHLQ